MRKSRKLRNHNKCRRRRRMDEILSYERNNADDYYSILGCSELSTAEQITTEYRIRVLDCHPDKNPGDLKAAERFTLLTKAKDTLINPESRAKYDKWRQSGIAMSYDDWCGLRAAAHTSMHWASKAPQPQISATGEQTAEATSPRKSREENMLSTSCDRPRERSPSPRQASPYYRAQHVDLTFSSKDKPFVTGNQVSWTPQAGSDLLQKFRNYQI